MLRQNSTFGKLLACVVATCLTATAALAFDTAARAAWVYGVATNTVLMDKNGEAALPPASMSKLMTINMLFEALKDGRVSMETTFPVSAEAVKLTAAGGSTMYLQQGDRPTVQELIQGIIVNSGNDACVVVAEGLAGSEAAFADLMTARGLAIGLEHSTFANASGWPDPRQRMSMKDLGVLSLRLITEFPEYYPVFAETSYNYKDRAPANGNNRNPLLSLGIGADGLKTGHTSEAGYGLVGSVKQGERRIIFAFSGTDSDTQRAEEAERISSWAFRQFSMKTILTAGSVQAEAPVFLGRAPSVALVTAADVRTLVPATEQGPLKAEVIYKGPIAAPIVAGTQLGEMIVHLTGLPDIRVPLVAQSDVAQAGIFARISAAATHAYARLFGA